MQPIFILKSKSGLRGYEYDEFVSQFDNICQHHLKKGRAKTFAFIVYDFHSPTYNILQDQGAMLDLDRLSGRNITVFYLNGSQNEQIRYQKIIYQNFNQVNIELTNQSISSVPFIFFFDFIGGDVTHVQCYSIRDDEKYILYDLTSAISERISLLEKTDKENNLSLSKTLIKKLATETPKIIYTKFIEAIFQGILPK